MSNSDTQAKSEEAARQRRAKYENQKRLIELEEANKLAEETNQLNERLIKSRQISEKAKSNRRSPISQISDNAKSNRKSPISLQEDKDKDSHVSIQIFKDNIQSPRVASIEVAPESEVDDLNKEIKGKKLR